MSLTPEERAQMEQEIRNLTCDLETSISGSVGDYQMVRFLDVILTSDKFWELFGSLPLPKTREQIAEIIAQREAKRARIRELQEQLEPENLSA